ncbi:MAG: CPBP family intramembrane glutamic endopeptidase [Pseudomonadota bacterium]
MTDTAGDQPSASAKTPSRARLWTECLLLFGGVPALMLATVGMFPLFPVLAVLAVVAVVLLAATPGFAWRELREGGLLRHWRILVLFTAVSVAAATVLTLWLRPEWFLAFPRYAPERWLLVMTFYPLVSALPQELIFRTLFFRRYGVLFPGTNALIAANAAVFGVGHLFYQNPVAIGLSAFAGAVIAWAYARTGSFALAWALHAIGGWSLFTIGLGRYFYHGAIPS